MATGKQKMVKRWKLGLRSQGSNEPPVSKRCRGIMETTMNSSVLFQCRTGASESLTGILADSLIQSAARLPPVHPIRLKPIKPAPIPIHFSSHPFLIRFAIKPNLIQSHQTSIQSDPP